MKNKYKTLGLVLALIGAAASVVGSLLDKKQTEELIDQKVQKRLAEAMKQE